MPIKQPDPQACSLHLFGVEGIGESLTLADIDNLIDNKAGPPGVVPSDNWAGPRLLDGQPDLRCASWLSNPAGLTTIVEGWVRATVEIADGGPVTPATAPPPSRSPATLTAAAPVKLRVSSTQWSAPVTMDSDRRIDVPSPHACVDVLTPDGWLHDPAPDREIEAVGGSLVWNVWLQIKICRAQGQSNYPALVTEQFTASAAANTFTVRPRAARRLFVTSDAAGGFDLAMFQGPGPNFNVGLLRRTLGGVVDLGPLPDFTHLRCPAIQNAPRITYLWDVTP